jgi:hypothetical protein
VAAGVHGVALAEVNSIAQRRPVARPGGSRKLFKTYSKPLNKMKKPGPWLHRIQPEVAAHPNQC